MLFDGLRSLIPPRELLITPSAPSPNVVVTLAEIDFGLHWNLEIFSIL
jgi:hypothetical protein